MRSVVKTSPHKENCQPKFSSVWILSKTQGSDNSNLLQSISENKIIEKEHPAHCMGLTQMWSPIYSIRQESQRPIWQMQMEEHKTTC